MEVANPFSPRREAYARAKGTKLNIQEVGLPSGSESEVLVCLFSRLACQKLVNGRGCTITRRNAREGGRDKSWSPRVRFRFRFGLEKVNSATTFADR